LELLALSVSRVDTYCNVLRWSTQPEALAHVSRNEPQVVVDLGHQNVVAFEVVEVRKQEAISLAYPVLGSTQIG
jgi:hypothetical protein